MNCGCKSCQDSKNTYLSGDYLVYQDKKRKDHIKPYAVWTGSFNFTKTAPLSFENAVVIQDAKIVEAYFKEYAQIAALSEPLDWTVVWIAPQWSFQTTT
jgi:phosphatidylserine/phosphatidylglycerophosphate/cardiolipin synthase-like enzyme